MSLERAVFASIGVSGALMTVIAFAFARDAAPSIAIGAAIALVNLWALRGIVRVLVAVSAGTRASSGSTVFLGLKLIALFAVVLLLLRGHVASAAPLALGYAALPIGVAIGALVCKKAGDDPV